LKVFVIPQNLLFSASSAEKCEFMGNPVWFLDTQQAFVGFLRIALPFLLKGQHREAKVLLSSLFFDACCVPIPSLPP
jgi:hypothetical protein